MHSESESQLGARHLEMLNIAFGGVRFEIEASSDLLSHVLAVPQLSVAERYGGDSGAAPASELEVRLRLRELGESPRQLVAPSASAPSGVLGARSIEWQWHAGGGRAVTRDARAELRAAGKRLIADGEIAGSARAAESLLTALASAALHRAGGAVLHAASVELACGVVAFVGPSGAGKSTACRHVAGAKPFSIDRLAVFPSREVGAWLAAPLPGGTGSAPGGELGAAEGKPLALVLRVRRAEHHTALSECSRIESVAALRASAFHAGKTPESESELLARLERLAGEVPFAEVRLLLGTPLEPLLGAWLAEQRSARPGARRAELKERLLAC